MERQDERGLVLQPFHFFRHQQVELLFGVLVVIGREVGIGEAELNCDRPSAGIGLPAVVSEALAGFDVILVLVCPVQDDFLSIPRNGIGVAPVGSK